MVVLDFVDFLLKLSMFYSRVQQEFSFLWFLPLDPFLDLRRVLVERLDFLFI